MNQPEKPRLLRSANPALRENMFTRSATPGAAVMTIQGTVIKTGALLLALIFAAAYTWQLKSTPDVQRIWMFGGLIGGLIAALITVFVPKIAMITAPVYALCEGFMLGAISSFFDAQYKGIVINAVGLTFGTLGCLLFAYMSGWIKATENFKLGVFAATGAIALVYLATMVLGFFGVQIPYIHGSGWLGIGFSLFVVVIAALNLVMDFDFIENGAEQGAPKYMEWYAAFGLLVTLIWLYLEFLRLLAKLRSRD